MFRAGGTTAAGGGGGLLTTFRRAVRAGASGAARDPLSQSSTSSSYKPISSSYLSSRPLVLSTRRNDDLDWVSVDGIGDEIEEGFDFDGDSVFGEVPSGDEVLNAVSALQLVVDPTHYSQFLEDNHTYNLESIRAQENASPTRFVSRVSSFGSESDWIEPSLNICYPRMLERHGFISAYDAFDLLRTEPSIKRIVISLSSDKTVWDAVLKNKMVRELRDSLREVESRIPEDLDDNNEQAETVNIFSRVYQHTKAKVIEVFEKIAVLVNELFRPPQDEKVEGCSTGRTDEMLQISMMLSIMVLIIVVLDRAYKA